MNSGRLSDLITFERRVLTPNEFNQQIESWVAEPYKTPAEAEKQSESMTRFFVRYRSDVRDGSTHRIIFDGKIFNIESVVPDRRRTILSIDCDFSMMVEVTHLQSTQREHITGLPLVRPADES